MPEYKSIRKHTLKSFLEKVESDAHQLYALMDGLPKENFFLYRFYDNTNRIDGYAIPKNNIYSLREFLDRYDTFHPKDEFGIYLSAHQDKIDADRAKTYKDKVSIDTAAQAIIPVLQENFNYFLGIYCEVQLRRNRPFDLSPENVTRFGFTTNDVAKLQRMIEHHNRTAKNTIRAEYDALRQLDFIKNEQK